MGRKGKVDTRRKPILQLDENKKSGAKANKKNPRKGESTAHPKYKPLYVDGGAGEVFDPQEQEKVAAEIETFLKEIVAASQQEKENSGGQSVLDEFTHPETMDTTVSSPLPSTTETAVDTTTISFWQAVVDAKTNRSYYWNPATNEVSWTLPPNSVISNEQPVPALTGTGEPAAAPVGGSLQDYYAYYSQQIYGVDVASQGQGSVVEEAKDKNSQVSHANPGAADVSAGSIAGATTAPDSPVTPGDGFIGPAPNKNKGILPNQDSPTVRGEKRLAEELQQSPSSGHVADSKKAKVQVEKSPAVGGRLKPTGTPSTTTSSASEQVLRFQVSTMADEFMRKLQYLHIGDEGLSPLQVMKIQLETRLEDWKDGGLPSKHMLSKLKDANRLVAEYEVSAAPAGWKCVWDSATCRYFYQNVSTAESSWEYPTHGPTSPAHSELSEQQLEQPDAGGRVEPLQMDVSTTQQEAPLVTDITPTITTTTLPEQEQQGPVVSAMVQPPPPPPVEPPPPPNTCLPVSTGQTYSSTSFNSVVTHSYIQPTAVPSAVPVIQVPDSTWVSSVAVQSPIPAPIPISTQTPVSESQQSKIKDATKTPKSAAKPANVEEKTLEEVRQKLQRPLRSGGLYDPEDFAPYEEPERARVQVEASTGMEFISEFPPTKPDVAVTAGPDDRSEKKKRKGKRGKKHSEDETEDSEQAPLPKEPIASEDIWNVPKATSTQKEPEIATSTQKEPEAAAYVHEPEPMFVLRDSDIEVVQEQVADSTPSKVPELVGNEYGTVAQELPKTSAVDFLLHRSDDLGRRQQWGQGVSDAALGDMLPTPPQEVVVEDRAIYGMEDMQGGMGADDMLQPSDELGYAGSVEVETVEMCIATSPSEQQDVTVSYGPEGGNTTGVLPESQPLPQPQLLESETDDAGKSLEESELILRERLLRRVMQQQQQQAVAAGDVPVQEADEGSVGGTVEIDDVNGKAPDVAESVELVEYGPDARLLHSGRGDLHSQVGLQLEVSTSIPTREQHPAVDKDRKDELASRADVQVEEEGEIVSTPEKRQRPETPKVSTGKASKRDIEREDSKSKSSSRHAKKRHSRSRSKSRERRSRRGRKHSDASDSGPDDYSRRSSRRGRKHHDDRSDSDDYHARRSRKHSDSDVERSASRKDRRHSRSVSRDSKDSRDKSLKRKKKDKKDKKKRRSHHSGSKERSGDDLDKKKNSTPQNIIVGKVGSLGSIRQLGQEKKAQASTPQPEQSPAGYQSVQQSQDTVAQGAAYYPQTPYMYGGYQYPYSGGGDQTWQGQQGWDQQQQGWQSTATTITPATATITAVAAGEQVWTATTTAASQQSWEQPQQQVEEQRQPDQVPVATEEHVWQRTEQEVQHSSSQESETRAVWEAQLSKEKADVPAAEVVVVPAEVQVEVEQQASHLRTGEDQEIVVEETVIYENSDIIEIPVDAEITECDMEIEQISSEAFLNEKRSRLAAAEKEKELPPGADTPPATERDKTPSPLQQEQAAVLAAPISASSAAVANASGDATRHSVQDEQPTKEKTAPDVQPVTGEGAGASTQVKEANGPQVNGEQGPQTPPKDNSKQDRSTPGTPTTAEPPPPTSGTVTGTPQTYNYGPYAAQTSVPAYDYSTYSQAGYDYSQAYSAYVQAAAASMAYASYSQYYANPYAAAFAGFGSPYAAYYSYANAAGAFQNPAQQAAAAPQTQQTDSGKKNKKEESKGMIEKWNNLQTQYGKPA